MSRSTTLTFTCLRCEREFTETNGNRERKYCSQKCASEAKVGRPRTTLGPIPERECPYCHRTFKPSARRVQHCSIRCASEARRLPEDVRIARRRETVRAYLRRTGKTRGLIRTMLEPGATYTDKHGYVWERIAKDPAIHTGERPRLWVQQHRLVMERKLGRPLRPGESVHHRNGVKGDNNPGNLELWTRPQPTGIRSEDAPHCPTCSCNPISVSRRVDGRSDAWTA